MKSLLTLLTVLIVAVGCNKSSNPATEYSDVKSLPKSGQVSKTQSFDLVPFAIENVGKSAAVAGERNEIPFEIKPEKRVLQFRVIPRKLPDGAVLNPTNDPKRFVMVWTPSKTIIDDIKQDFVDVQIDAVVVKATEPRLEGTAAQSVTFQIRLSRVSGLPQISDVRGLIREENEITRLNVGTITNLTLYAMDPAGSAANPPDLLWGFCEIRRNSETLRESGLNYLKLEGRRALSPTTYQYDLTLDLKNNLVPVTSDPEGIELCFKLLIRSNSGSGLTSAPIERVVKAIYGSKKPDITAASSQKVWPGQEVPFEFKVSAYEFGDLQITASDLTQLPGSTELECTPDLSFRLESQNRRICYFTWTVPADMPEGQQSIRLSASHSVVRNGKPVTSTTEKIVKFLIQSGEKPVPKKAKPTKAKGRRTASQGATK